MTKALREAIDLLELAAHLGRDIGQNAPYKDSSLWRGLLLTIDEAKQRVMDAERSLEMLEITGGSRFEAESLGPIVNAAEVGPGNRGEVRQLVEKDKLERKVVEVRKRA